MPAHVDLHNHLRKLRRERPLHLTLLDPGKSDTATIGRMARGAAEAGTDVIMVGGSTGLSLERVDAAVLEIKAQTHLPVILFPTVAKAVSTKADAIFFMSLLNSTERRFLVGEQIASAAMVHQSGLQPLSMAYLIVEPGMVAARVGKAKPLPRDDPRQAVAHVFGGEDGLFRIMFRAEPDEVMALQHLGDPYFKASWGSDVVGLLLDDDTDWAELAELLTDSYCVQAPERLAAQVDRPG